MIKQNNKVQKIGNLTMKKKKIFSRGKKSTKKFTYSQFSLKPVS